MDLGASCEFDRIAQQAVIIGAVLNTGYETTVDLDLIETEIFQIAEAGIPVPKSSIAMRIPATSQR